MYSKSSFLHFEFLFSISKFGDHLRKTLAGEVVDKTSCGKGSRLKTKQVRVRAAIASLGNRESLARSRTERKASRHRLDINFSIDIHLDLFEADTQNPSSNKNFR